LTTSNIVASSTELTNFAAAKTARGFQVQVIDNADTASGGWGGGQGDTAAENIKAWLVANYTNGNSEQIIDYVLLVGNPHPTNGAVPMKACYPQSTNSMCPSDYYYTDMTADWDVNTNGFSGEWSDYPTNDAPTGAELAVGRIPYYGDISDLDSILAKIVAYEAVAATNATWRLRCLLPMQSDLFFNTYHIGDWIKDNVLTHCDWEHHRVYDQGSPETSPCTIGNVVGVWTGNTFGAVFWWGHGQATNTPDIMDVAHSELLDDSHPAFLFQGSCRNAWPEATNNLAYSLLKNGAISTVAATREEVYVTAQWPWTPVDTAPNFVIRYAENLILHQMPSGAALNTLKATYEPTAAERWQNYLIHNVYGCPAGNPTSVRFSGPGWSM